MPNNIIAHTEAEWETLANNGDAMGVAFMNNRNLIVERHAITFPEAYTQDEMQDIHRYWYQKLADLLQKPIYATGSVLRGYWRSKEYEDNLVKKYNATPKYSDFDVDDSNVTKKEIELANKKLNPIANFSLAKWERVIEFKPNN